MCTCGRQGMVFLQPEGQEICDGAKNKPGHDIGLLEGHGQGPAREPEGEPRRNEKDARVLSGPGSQRKKDRLGHARVSPRARPETR